MGTTWRSNRHSRREGPPLDSPHMSLRKVLASGAKLSPPGWMADNLCYETMMGSVAYGVSSDTSDMDVYGICLPPKDMVFPHLAGEILGFGSQIKRFESWQQHHIA